MRKMLDRVKNSKGFVSVETVIVGGLILGLSVFTVSAFNTNGNNVTKNAMGKISNANSTYTVVNPQP